MKKKNRNYKANEKLIELEKRLDEALEQENSETMDKWLNEERIKVVKLNTHVLCQSFNISDCICYNRTCERNNNCKCTLGLYDCFDRQIKC